MYHCIVGSSYLIVVVIQLEFGHRGIFCCTWVDGLSNELSTGETGSQILLMVIKHSHLIVLLVDDITGNSPRILLHSGHNYYWQVAGCVTPVLAPSAQQQCNYTSEQGQCQLGTERR